MLQQFKQKRVKYNYLTHTRDYHKEKQCYGVDGGMKTSLQPVKLEDDKLSYMHNCFILDGWIMPRFGYDEFGLGLPLPNSVVKIHQYFAYDGTNYLVVFTTRCIYVYNTSTKYFDLISPNVLVFDCETALTVPANVTGTADDTWCRYGTYSAKLAIAAGFTTGVAGYVNFSNVDYRAYTHLHAYIKSDIATALGDIEILVDNTNNCASPLETLKVPALAAGVATEINLVFSNPTALGAIVSIGVKVATDKGAQNINIDDIRMVKCMTGTTANRIYCDTIYDSTDAEVKFLMTNFADNIMFWTGTGNFADLAGSPDKAKFLKNYYNYMILAHCTTSGSDYPTKVEWSVNTKPEDMTGSGSGNNSLTSSSGKISGIEELQGQLILFRERSLTNMVIVAGVYEATQTPIPFEFTENKISGKGTPAGDTIQKIGDKLIYFSWDGINIYDLYSFKDVSADNLRIILSNINPAQVELSHAVLIEEYNLYILFVPNTGATETNTAWVFDYTNNKCLGVWEFSNSISACGKYKANIDLTIGELTGTIGSFTWMIGDSKPESLFAYTILGDVDGNLYKFNKNIHNDNGVAITSYFDTKAYCWKLGYFTRFAQLFTKMLGTTIDISVSIDNGKTFSVVETITTDNDEDIDELEMCSEVEKTSESMIVRFGNSVLDGWFKIAGWTLKYIEKEKIR